MRIRNEVLASQMRLTDRDLRLLGWLHDHGVFTTPQITGALFTSASFGQRRLSELRRRQLIDRFRPQKPDGGSFPYHYVLDQLGYTVVAGQRLDPLPRPGYARTRLAHLTSRANLHHLCGVNGFFTDLAAHARTHPGSALDRWWPAARFQGPGAFFQAGDGVDVSLAGAKVRPDGHGVWIDQGRSVPFYLEYDTGTEPLHILVAKVVRYRVLAIHTHRWWPVLFALPTSRREWNLQQRLADDYGYTDLPIATISADHPETAGLGPAGAVWWLHGRYGARQRLTDLPNDNYHHGPHPGDDNDPDLPEVRHDQPI
jgi:hypothetical protein